MKNKILIFLIIVLLAVNVFSVSELRSAKSALAFLQPDNLVILPLYNGVGNRTGSKPGQYDQWAIFPEYDSSAAIFAVLPAGSPPYTWTLEDPTIMDLSPTSQGFLVKGIVKKAGSSLLRVKDSTGLKGEIKIETEKMAGAEDTPVITPKDAE